MAKTCVYSLGSFSIGTAQACGLVLFPECRLYWNPNTGQQRTFNLRRLADFTPLDVLEQRSRMLLPYIHSLLGRAMPTSSGSSTVAPKLEGARARTAKEAGTLRALSHAEIECERD